MPVTGCAIPPGHQWGTRTALREPMWASMLPNCLHRSSERFAHSAFSANWLARQSAEYSPWRSTIGASSDLPVALANTTS